MNNGNPKVVQVTMTQDCWRVLHAVALEKAMQLEADRRTEPLTELLKLMPTISAASEHPAMDDVEDSIRDATRIYMEADTRRMMEFLAQELPPEDRDDFMDGLDGFDVDDLDGLDFGTGEGWR